MMGEQARMATADATTEARPDRGAAFPPRPAPRPGVGPLTPLVLDLDGALIRTDLLYETALAYCRAAPWRIVLLLLWLLKGRAHLKRRLAEAVALDVSLLPVNEELAAWAAEERGRGRPVHLATASDEALARAVARRFAFIGGVHGSDGRRNLKGPEKAALLARLFPEGFVYAGDSRADLAVWRVASGIVLAGATPDTAAQARAIATPLAEFPRPNRLRAAWRLLRPHQWVKNALVFVPLALGGAALDPGALAATLLAFAALSLAASGTYVANDLLDVADDRRHWTKRNRPLASGALPVPHGLGLGLAALAAGFALAAAAGWPVLAGVAAYTAGTLAYSFKLKRIPLVDVAALAALFTGRLAIGAAAAGVALSSWLLTFSMFLFLSLSLAKRHTELARAKRSGRAPGARGYEPADEPVVLALGVGALAASVLVFVLYLTEEAFLRLPLPSPQLLWAYPPVLFLFGARIWLLSGRGALDDDPVAFAVRNRFSLALLAILCAAFGLAWTGGI
jgi:4-hydroxybenzoate polyprenyltransferase